MDVQEYDKYYGEIIMKEKIVCVCLVLLIFISLVIFLFTTFYNIWLFIIDVIITLYLCGFYMEKKFVKKRLPNIMTSKRNYENIIMCDECCLKDIEIDKENTLILSNYNRNLYVDFLILQRYYSFLKSNGLCIFVFDFENDKYFRDTKIDSLDYIFLHIVTLYENNINLESFKFKMKNILNKYKILFYSLKIYCFRRTKKTDIEIIEQSIETIEKFVKERNLKLKIYTKGIKDLEKIQSRYNNIKFEKSSKGN